MLILYNVITYTDITMQRRHMLQSYAVLVTISAPSAEIKDIPYSYIICYNANGELL